MEFTFKPGDRVCWVNAVLDLSQRDVPGTVLQILPNDMGVEAFTLYEIEFPFGTFTLYGTQMEPAREVTKEK